MATLLSSSDYPEEYDLGDKVSFTWEGIRLYGEVVRVYNTREDYHVLVDGQRYSVSRNGDDMNRA